MWYGFPYTHLLIHIKNCIVYFINKWSDYYDDGKEVRKFGGS